MENKEKTRIISGLIMGGAVVLFVLLAPIFLFKLAVILVGVLAQRELFQLIRPSATPFLRLFSTLLLIFWLAILLFGQGTSVILFGALAVVWGSLLVVLFSVRDLEEALPDVMSLIFSTFYVGTGIACLGLIRQFPQGTGLFFLTASATFLSDTGGYFVGTRYGKTPFSPRVSPKKTMEGYWGGACASVLAAFICKMLFWNTPSFLTMLFLGLLIGLIAPFGDLCESMIKRSVHVKDSGNLIPGHGGILDRIDALLLAAPLVYLYVIYFL